MSFVYFIQAGGSRGAVKIGHSKNVAKRMDAIRTSNPLPLKLLHQANHGADAPTAEKRFHEQCDERSPNAWVGIRLREETQR